MKMRGLRAACFNISFIRCRCPRGCPAHNMNLKSLNPQYVQEGESI